MADCDIEVTCLIDALAPPPASDLPYSVVRPFDMFVQSGKADHWPRLFVVGDGGDSLPIIEALHAAPGAVITATHSLFGIALPWLQTSPDFPGNLMKWLSNKFGNPGAVVANAYINHRRSNAALGEEIPAFDLLLKSATGHLTFGPLQTTRMTAAGFDPIEILAASTVVQTSADRTGHSPLHVSVIGANAEIVKAASQALNSSAASRRLHLTFLDRYSADCAQEILTSDAIAILDGHNAVSCPHFNLAAANSIPVMTAGQHWTSALPPSAHIRLDYPATAVSLVHAIAAMVAVDGLFAGLATGLKASCLPGQQGDVWAATVLRAAATARPAKLAETYPLAQVSEPALYVKPSQSDSDNPGGIFALIGAVPAPPILRHFYPEIDRAASPRFMTPEAALTAANFMQLPAAQLQDRMGFEAPLIASEQNGPITQSFSKKTQRWTDVQPGLRRAREALTFGCNISGAGQAMPVTGQATWPFAVAPEITENPMVTSAYDAESGIYWSYDPVRGALKCLILTGGAGHLGFHTGGETSFVVTDLSSTQTVSRQTDGRFTISVRGLGLFKIAVLPSSENSDLDMMKSLAQGSLHLKWSYL